MTKMVQCNLAVAALLLCMAVGASAGRQSISAFQGRSLLDAVTPPACTAFPVTFSPSSVTGTTIYACKNAASPQPDPSPNPAVSAYIDFTSPTTCRVGLTVTPSDSAPSGTPGCETFTRTWTASGFCFPTSGTTITASYTLRPPATPGVSISPPSYSGPSTFTTCPATLPTVESLAPAKAGATASDSCGNPLTGNSLSGPTATAALAKVSGQCKAQGAVTYSAVDCAGTSATSSPVTIVYQPASGSTPTVTVTKPGDLYCKPKSGSSLCSSTGAIAGPVPFTDTALDCKVGTTPTTIATYLSSATKSSTCDIIGGASSWVSPSATGVGSLSGVNGVSTVSGTTITLLSPVTTNNVNVAQVTWKAKTDCADDTKIAQVYLSKCTPTVCPYPTFKSKGGWSKEFKDFACVTGSTCAGSLANACGNIANPVPLPSEPKYPSPYNLCVSEGQSTLTSCAGGSSSGVDNYITQLASMYLNVHCGSTFAVTSTTAISKSGIVALNSQCAYLGTRVSGDYITLLQIYLASYAEATATGGNTEAVAGCLGNGIIPAFESSTQCISLLA